jgi:hypothetical protein
MLGVVYTVCTETERVRTDGTVAGSSTCTYEGAGDKHRGIASVEVEQHPPRNARLLDSVAVGTTAE